jgi:hypothetical protein
MIEEKYLHIEMISPRSWSCGTKSGEVVAEFEGVTSHNDRASPDDIILTIPLHEDFFDFCKSYCDQYREYIQEKIK